MKQNLKKDSMQVCKTARFKLIFAGSDHRDLF